MNAGDIIGDRYYLKKILGQGAGGVVFLALDDRLYKSVAVKVLYSEDAEQIDHEIQFQKGLSHPMLPLILDVVMAEKKCCIVMEYVDGMTLDAYLEKNGPMEERQTVGIALQLLDVLKYLHTCRPPVIYQDLKPANIMLCRNGSVKLIDFGTSAYRYYDGRRVIPQGTKGYASPEQLAGDGRQIGVQSDLYSFGAVLYSMLTGIRLQYPPYRMDDIRILFPHISEQIVQVIEGCTAQDLSARFQDAESIAGVILSREVSVARKKKQKLRYTARVKSVFLSAKKHAGLWGAVIVLGVWQLAAGNIGAAVKDQLLLQGISLNTVLPVTVYNEMGQKVLIQYGSVYDLHSDFFLEVPKESLPSDSTATLKITVSGPFGSPRRERVFLLNPVQ